MRAVIIGANGYLGRNLAFILNKKKWQLQLVDLEETSILNYAGYQQCDVSKKAGIAKINFDTDIVFHFAGLTGTKGSIDQYEKFILANEIGLLNVLDHMKEIHNAPRIVFPSTRLVYEGMEEVPLSETALKEFKTVYAINKFACEQYLRMFSNLYGIKYTVFRICVPYGNLTDNSYSYGTIGFFLDKASKGQDITLFGDGKLKRTFTHVQDLIGQILACLNKDESINEVFNIGGETFSLSELALLVSELFSVNVAHVEWPSADLLIESGDTIFDNSKLQKLTSYETEKQLQTWIKSLKI